MSPGPRQRPLLFLDVDGPLIPFGLPPHHYPTFPPVASSRNQPHPLLARINPAHGRQLAALPGELAWATTWGAEANELIAPRIGLPPMKVVAWPGPSPDDEQDARIGLHWKTRALITWAEGRPFAWADDEITDMDRDWARAYHPGPALLHHVDPRHGLTEADYTTLGSWLQEHQGPQRAI